MMNIEKNITPKELRDLAVTQNALKRLHALSEAAKIRKQINTKLLEAATKGDTFCLIEKPENEFAADALISMLKDEGFKVTGEDYLEYFIHISWGEETEKIESK